MLLNAKGQRVWVGPVRALCGACDRGGNVIVALRRHSGGKTGLGRSWAGAVLLAGATSLPELATGTSAVAVIGDVSLAAGGVVGNCSFNLLLLALLDVANGRRPLFRDASLGHTCRRG